ncbi:protein-disulfide reductase DsbD domain-containing protein [Paenirhodobacter enshiensis]|uniref:protein-disulfide reductase DsbD domain-containing protein n=1 Tax=Paenirhodobacter enshiensis TaxID=1105367 RepID=UPI003FA32639
MLRPIAVLVAPFLVLVSGFGAGQAEISPPPDAGAPLPPGLVSAEIAPGWQDPDGRRTAALKLVLDPGWKTYWRVPGEAGVPPSLDFSESENLKNIEVIWPVPQAFDQNGMRSVGYLGGMVLPLRITPADPTRPVVLHLGLGIGICHDICVPADLVLSRTLDGPGAADATISQALDAVPHRVDSAIAHCRIEPIADGMRVTARIVLPGAGRKTGAGLAPSPGSAPPDTARETATLFELRSQPMWTSDPVETRDGAVLEASADFVPATPKPFDLDPGDLRITVLGPGPEPSRAIEIDGCPAP